MKNQEECACLILQCKLRNARRDHNKARAILLSSVFKTNLEFRTERNDNPEVHIRCASLRLARLIAIVESRALQFFGGQARVSEVQGACAVRKSV